MRSPAAPDGGCVAARIRLLGAPSLGVGGGAAQPLGRRDAALLALLAFEGALARSRAAALLWGDADPAKARNSLRQRLFRLRRAAGVDLIVGDETLRLGPSVEHDLQDPLAALERDAAALSPGLLAAHHFTDLEELARWVDQARLRWSARVIAALETLAQRHEDAAQLDLALRYARRLLAEDPMAEASARRVMRLHYLQGDTAAALKVYDQLRSRLQGELGVPPDSATRDLAALLLRSSPAPRPAASGDRPSLLRPPRLIGRAQAWATACRTLAAGQGVLLLSGPPGIGKTRLLSEIAAMQPKALAAAALLGDAQTPWATLARLLRALVEGVGAPADEWVRAELARVVPGLGVCPAGVVDHLRLRQALERYWAQVVARGATLLLVDDLQYADEASLESLLMLADAGSALGADTGCVWVWAVRQGEWPPTLVDWHARAACRPVWREDLGALDEPEVGELLASLDVAEVRAPDWAAAMHRHTAGNPLFILETLREYLAGAGTGRAAASPPAALPSPPTVRQLLAGRLERLDDPARSLAQLAAVAGQDFDAPLAAAALTWAPSQLIGPWAALERAEILHGDRFTHDLLQEIVLQSVPLAVAPLLHLRVAEALEARDGAPARRAHHWAAAGQWTRAARGFLQAAAAACQASQSGAEAALCDQAAAAFERAGDAAAAFGAREQQLYASRYALPLARQLELADQLLRTAASPAQRMAALEAQATVLIEDFRDDAIVAAASEARRLAIELGEPLRELRASRLEARALARSGYHDRAQTLLAAYLPRVRALDRPALGARLLAEFGCALMSCNRYAEGAALFDEAHAAALALDDAALLLECHEHRAWAQACAGDIEAEAASYEAARALAPRLGLRRQPALVGLSILARTYKELGRFDAALALLEELRHEHGPAAAVEVAATTDADLSDVWLWLGQPERARAALRPVADSASATMRRGYWLAQARVQQALGQDATAALDRALQAGLQEGGLYGRLVVMCEQAFVLAPEPALALATPALAQSRAVGLELTSAPLRAACCDALRRVGRAAEAAEQARALLAHFERRPPFVLFPPRYWFIAAAALRAAGDPAGAAQALECARHWIDQVARVPPPWIEGFRAHARRQLANAPVTPPV